MFGITQLEKIELLKIHFEFNNLRKNSTILGNNENI